MFIRWLLVLAFSFQITSALAQGTDFRDPANLPKAIKNYDNSFNQVGKQAAYLRKYASGQMDTIINQINGEHVVTNRIRDSIADPDTGKKIKIEANVTQKADKAKVASTLTDRLKKAKDYAAKTGKASIPAFVGMAAFNGLMEGIDWVMDEGGKVTMPPLPDDLYRDHSHLYECRNNATMTGFRAPSMAAACNAWGTTQAPYYTNVNFTCNTSGVCSGTYTFHQAGYPTSQGSWNSGFYAVRVVNPNYIPDYVPEHVEVNPDQIAQGVREALESNNPALAAAITEAIKAAYTPESPAIAPISDAQSNGLAESATDSARDAVNRAANNDGTDPSSHGKPGYYKITDGDKTIEGYVYPSDTTSTGLTDSTTVTNPDGSTTTTGTTSSMWPNFCDWAGVVCEFIDWVKEDEYLPDDEQPEIDESIFDREFDIELFAVADCPPNPVWNFTFINSEWSKEIDITMICDFFRWLGFGINIAAGMTAMWIVYSAVVVRDQA